MGRYNIATVKVGTLLDDSDAVAILERIAPGVSSNPMISLARGMSLDAALGAAGGRVDDATKQRLRDELSAL
ncbi:hypothetical protein E6C70_12990 [Glaciibacter flavus]|uniref:Uncharacterized protein n=1 Tax=Orlajensenia flava TaxID=2565934 RepID=A0A4S4FQR7_9MICO|nr:hypothetical protein E6C70_12990 [Glaciibacter flavus]